MSACAALSSAGGGVAGVLAGVVLGVVTGALPPPGSTRVATGPDEGDVTDEMAFPIERNAPITTAVRTASSTRTRVSQNHHRL